MKNINLSSVTLNSNEIKQILLKTKTNKKYKYFLKQNIT